MTDRARLELIFDQRYVGGEGCFLITTVDKVVTQPDELDACLVVQRAGSAIEKFIRVATTTDLTTLSALPPLVTVFKSAAYAAAIPMVGDLIHMGEGLLAVPPVWRNLHSYAGSHIYEVVDVTDPMNVLVLGTNPFPDYGRDIGFYVYRADGVTEVIPSSSPASDGEADRPYTGMADFYLADIHHDFLSTSIDDALDFAIARRGEAQSVVNALNVDGYTGVFEELFE